MIYDAFLSNDVTHPETLTLNHRGTNFKLFPLHLYCVTVFIGKDQHFWVEVIETENLLANGLHVVCHYGSCLPPWWGSRAEYCCPLRSWQTWDWHVGPPAMQAHVCDTPEGSPASSAAQIRSEARSQCNSHYNSCQGRLKMHLHVPVLQHPGKQAHSLIACWAAGNWRPDAGGYLETSYCAIGCWASTCCSIWAGSAIAVIPRAVYPMLIPIIRQMEGGC